MDGETRGMEAKWVGGARLIEGATKRMEARWVGGAVGLRCYGWREKQEGWRQSVEVQDGWREKQ
eukprot:9090428-Prorocentrum_lima.AAC.1